MRRPVVVMRGRSLRVDRMRKVATPREPASMTFDAYETDLATGAARAWMRRWARQNGLRAVYVVGSHLDAHRVRFTLHARPVPGAHPWYLDYLDPNGA